MRRRAKASTAGSTSGTGNHRGLFGVLVVAAALACLTLGAANADAYLLLGKTFGGAGTGDGKFNEAIGVAANEASGDSYIVDRGNDRIQRFDSAGNYLSQFGVPGSGAGQFQEPETVAVDQADGSVYVLDHGNSRVEKFTAAGAFVKQFGSAGNGNGQFSNPHGIAVDPSSGDVYVADAGNSRVERFNSNGEYQSQFGEAGSAPGQLGSPARVAVDSTGAIYVLEEFGRIQKFDSNGVYLNTIGANYPFDFALDQTNGHLLVLEYAPSFEKLQITEHDPSGAVIESYEASTQPPQGFQDGLAFNSTTRDGYVADGNRVTILSEPPPIFNQTAAPTYSEVQVGAKISPEDEVTTYHFEYGLTSSYGSSTAVKTIPAGHAPVRVAAQILNLKEGTTYHFRAISINGHGENRGEDQSFTTLSYATGSVGCPNAAIREAQGAGPLADCRAWEMVSPAFKNGSDIYLQSTQSSVDGEAVVFQSAGAFSGAEGGAHGDDYISRRTASGWSVEPITPYMTPNSEAPYAEAHGYEAFTADLSKGVLVNIHSPSDKTGNTSEDQRLLYLRNGPGEYLQVTPPAANPLRLETPTYAGSSANMSSVYFESSRHLTLDSPPEGIRELYRWSSGTISVVGVLPNGEVAPEGAALGRGVTTTNTQPAIAADGSQVVFQSGSPQQVYLRVAGATTIALSASQKSGSAGELAPSGASFAGSATDGKTLSRVYFTSPDELTDDANTGSSGQGNDLYEYDIASGTLTDLTVTNSPENPNGAGVEGASGGGFVGSANDGSYLYFNATGNLAPGGSANNNSDLYVEHDGEIVFVANFFSFVRTVVSENGQRLLIFTSKQLTSHETNGFEQAYVYDAPSDTMTCISCPDGRPATANAANSGFITGYTHVMHYARRNLSPDGKRVFFETEQSLDPRDSNGLTDVYKWEEGKGVSLISSGRGGEPSHFLDASPSGRDAFIVTREQLLPSDRDSNTDVYDARVNGGLPLSPVPGAACEGDACQSPPNPPNDPTPASAGFRGAGNPPARFAKKKQARKHRKKHGRHRDRHASGKHTTRRHG